MNVLWKDGRPVGQMTDAGEVLGTGGITGKVDSTGKVTDAYGNLVGNVDKNGFVFDATDLLAAFVDSKGNLWQGKNLVGQVAGQENHRSAAALWFLLRTNEVESSEIARHESTNTLPESVCSDAVETDAPWTTVATGIPNNVETNTVETDALSSTVVTVPMTDTMADPKPDPKPDTMTDRIPISPAFIKSLMEESASRSTSAQSEEASPPTRPSLPSWPLLIVMMVLLLVGGAWVGRDASLYLRMRYRAMDRAYSQKDLNAFYAQHSWYWKLYNTRGDVVTTMADSRKDYVRRFSKTSPQRFLSCSLSEKLLSVSYSGFDFATATVEQQVDAQLQNNRIHQRIVQQDTWQRKGDDWFCIRSRIVSQQKL